MLESWPYALEISVTGSGWDFTRPVVSQLNQTACQIRLYLCKRSRRRLQRSWRVWCGPACGWCLMGPGGWWTVESRRGESDQIAAELTTADGRTDIFIELITGREITGVTGVLGTSWSWSGGCWHICSIRQMQLAATNEERKCEDKE